jgi:hypothetical protein
MRTRFLLSAWFGVYVFCFLETITFSMYGRLTAWGVAMCGLGAAGFQVGRYWERWVEEGKGNARPAGNGGMGPGDRPGGPGGQP